MTTAARKFPTHILVFLAPALVIYSLFMVYPLIDSIRLSLYAPVDGGGFAFVGLANYVTLFTDAVWSKPFWNALENNFLFFAIHMLVQNPIGLALAALLSLPRLRGRGLYRTLIFFPTMLSVVIVGFIWQLILSPLWGVSQTLLDLVGLKSLFQPWLGLEGSALVTLGMISVWQFVGVPMMLIYAALLAIPEELNDAGTVDGANQFHIFVFIKLPLILPTIAMVSILTFVANFNAFDLIYAVKGALAGPNFSTDIMGTLFYRTFFGYQLQAGSATMGAVIATAMFLVILIGVMLYLWGIQRRLKYFQL